MATTSVADYLQKTDHWENHDPDYVTLLNSIGAGSAATHSQVAATVLGLAARSPTVLLFQIEGDEDFIHIGHNPTRFPEDPLDAANPFNNKVVVLVGNDLASAVPVVLPDEAFQRTTQACCRNADVIAGNTMHTAAPPVLRDGPHAPTVGDASDIRVRRAMVVPPGTALSFVSNVPNGRIGVAGMWTTFIQVGLGNPDPAVVARYEPIRDWWRSACTNATGDLALNRITPVTTAAPATTMSLNRHVARLRVDILNKVGVGGPGLTTAAFDAGMAGVRNVIETTANEKLQFERDRLHRSFTDKHGGALAARLYTLCDVPDDDHLPEIHRLLAKSSSKSRDYAIIAMQFVDRARLSSVPLNAGCAPMASTKLVDEVFRSFRPAGTGLTFGVGLSPFSIVCEGHAEMALIAKMIKQAELTEAGTSVSLADAERIVASDVRFPSSARVAEEKLYGWSIVMDVFHGAGHDVCVSTRTFVKEVGPLLHRICDQVADSPGVGMDLVCRVLYEAQQEYFEYVNQLASGAAPPVPTYNTILGRVRTFRAASLCPLPTSWYSLVDAPPDPNRRAATGGNAGRGDANANRPRTGPTFNTHADRRLMQRFRDSEHATISDMMRGHSPAIPTHNGQPVCLAWALRGECTGACRRSGNHVRYGRNTIQDIHGLMDTCGVAASQN